MTCHVSNQIAQHAAALGREEAREAALERLTQQITEEIATAVGSIQRGQRMQMVPTLDSEVEPDTLIVETICDSAHDMDSPVMQALLSLIDRPEASVLHQAVAKAHALTVAPQLARERMRELQQQAQQDRAERMAW